MDHSLAAKADPYALYQASVQGVAFEQAFTEQCFLEIRGRMPTSLREDFCGTALAACDWVRRAPENTAVAIDLDTAVLAWAFDHNVSGLSADQGDRIRLLEADVLTVNSPAVDMVQAFNFSYWIFRERQQMLRYFRNVYNALVDDGVFFLDVFGGYEAHQTQREATPLEGFEYVWEQAHYNAVTAEMQCYIHFQFPDNSSLERAFSYCWRVWGVRELREILCDAGFSTVRLYRQAFDDETDEPLDAFIETDDAEDYACWIGYLMAEK